MDKFLFPLIGGGIIGLAASLMLLLNGRVMGVSGIVKGVIDPRRGDVLWRALFIAGLLCGGALLHLLDPQILDPKANRNLIVISIAGMLVGFGTALGSGCTSGHGICGVSRLSPRSIVATLTFMSAGILMATLIRTLGDM